MAGPAEAPTAATEPAARPARSTGSAAPRAQLLAPREAAEAEEPKALEEVRAPEALAQAARPAPVRARASPCTACAGWVASTTAIRMQWPSRGKEPASLQPLRARPWP